MDRQTERCRYEQRTAIRDVCSEVDGDMMLVADVCIVGQSSAEAGAATSTGLEAALLVVHAGTNICMARRKLLLQKHITPGSIKH